MAVVAPIDSPATAQQTGLSCAGMVYENKNQTDYGPLKIAVVRGAARDTQGVMVPGVCIGIFTANDHKLIMATQTSSEGRFDFNGVPRGEYRLVAKCEGFCSANAKIWVDPALRNKTRLDLAVLPAGIDTCSYFKLK
jgi:carboxypeptidase family protein